MATPFLTDNEEVFYITDQIISLIPVDDPLLDRLDQEGVPEPAHQRIRVSEGLHDAIMAVYGRRRLRNIIEDHQRTLREREAERARQELEQAENFFDIGEPDPPAPATANPFLDALTTRNEFWRTTRPTVVPEWVVFTGAEGVIMPENFATQEYSEVIENLMAQLEDLHQRIDDAQSEIMEWARERWEREQPAIPERTEETNPEPAVTGTAAGATTDAGIGRTELHGYTADLGVPENQRAVIRNVQ